jgi:hypothetical protein
MTKNTYRRWRLLVAGLVLAGAACSTGPQVVVSQPVADSADVPYRNVLVVALFSSFDARRYLEKETVDRLKTLGIAATPSTSMMDTRTPVTAQTFIDMVDEIGADAVLLTQLTSYGAQQTEVDARPEATVNYWPTYYFNVFAVELTEYVEPPRLNIEHSLVLATQLYSVATREPVWGIESRSSFVEIEEDGLQYRIFEDEAEAIVRRLRRDGLVGAR